MNRFFTLLCCVVFTTLCSCQFTETIYLNADGSGKMEFMFDGGLLMQMAGEQMGDTQEQAIDSTFSFKDLFKTMQDSISKLPEEEQQKLKRLEPFNMHMVMNPETSEMRYNLFTDFKNVSDLQDMFKAINDISNVTGNAQASEANNPLSGLGADGNTSLDYNFDGKTFKRIAKVINREAYKQVTDSLEQMTMMFASSTYKLNYHFPKRIQSVSNENALISDDRKSITVEFGFMDYITDPEALNLEVVLED